MGLREWLLSEGCTHVAMESTGVYWKPIYAILEGLAGLNSVVIETHAGSELRSLVAHIKGFHPRKVDIHFRTELGLATIMRSGTAFEGVVLPGWIGDRFQKMQATDRESERGVYHRTTWDE